MNIENLAVNMPSAPTSELQLIGAAIISKEALYPIVTSLQSKDFYTPSYKLVFEAIKEIVSANKQVNITSVLESLDNNKTLEIVGGISFIKEIAEQIVYVGNFQENIDIVKDKSLVRDMLNLCNNVINVWKNDAITPADYLTYAEEMILNITRQRKIGQLIDMQALSNELLEQFKLGKNSDELPISTGFADLDNLIGGFNKEDLVIVAARPSVGKTALALNFAVNTVKNNKKVAIFSIEMPSKKLINRILASETTINLKDIATKKFNSPRDTNLYIKGLEQISKWPLLIDESTSLALPDLIGKARKIRDLDMIIIDYIGLMRTLGKRDRYLEIAEISRGLKQLARELHIPVIALCQLSREVESRTNGKIYLSDLRDSGSIEQDADLVMLLSREDYQKTDEERSVIEINVAKHRNGATGKVELVFFKNTQRFASLSTRKE